MNEEEFEDMLGIKYGWPKPMGLPKWPLILPLIVWVIVIALALAGALYASGAFADEAKPTYSSTDSHGNLVRITSEPCPEVPTWLGLYRAEMRYEGVDYLACWFELMGVVMVLDSNGDATPIQARAFSKDEPL